MELLWDSQSLMMPRQMQLPCPLIISSRGEARGYERELEDHALEVYEKHLFRVPMGHTY